MKYLTLFKKYINFNKNFFGKKKFNNKNKDIILVESFDLKATIISLSLFSNSFKNQEKLKIITFFSTHQSLRKVIKIYFNWYLNFFSYLKLFRSFGSEKFLIPRDNINSKKIDKITLKILKNIKKKSDVLKIKIENIYLGDLLYDTYIRENNLITIDINSNSFKKFISKSVKLYFFWNEYFRKFRVKSIIATHSVYLTALPLRIAIKHKIDVFCVNFDKIFRLTNKRPLVFGNFEDYPDMFKNLSNQKKKKGLLLAKLQLQKRFKGQKDILYEESEQVASPITDGTYSSNSVIKNRVIENNKNFKILIAAHDFNDAPHVHKDLIFEDMYEWLNFLGKKSLVNESFDWYIKLHPAEFDYNFKKIQYFLLKYKKFKLLPKIISHKQLINEGINCVLTCYGSIGHEYPFFGIPVINAGHNPHIAYKFNFHPKNKKEYEDLLKKITTLKVNKKFNKQIYQFYMVRYYLDYNLFPDIRDTKSLDSIDIFKKFFERYDMKSIKKIKKEYQKFIYSKNRRLISTEQIK
jgi:hypothetical protein